MLKIFITDFHKGSKAGKFTGYRLAYSVREIKRRNKNKPAFEAVIKHGKGQIKLICERVKIIETIRG